MAAELNENPSIPHTPEHDLESVYWVLLWLTLLYMKTSWASGLRSSTLGEAMTPKVYFSGGGTSKLHFIRDKVAVTSLFTTDSPRMGVLLRRIHKVFRKQCIKMEYLRLPPKEDESTDTDEIRQMTQNEVEPEDLHATLINIFNKALEKEKGWGSNDVATFQTVELSRDMESTVQSGSKRSRDMTDQNADFNASPLAKRLLS